MLGYGDRDNGERERQRILDQAQKVNGGQTTTWKLINSLKIVSQKFNVADLIKIERLGTDGVKVILGVKLNTRLLNQRNESSFWNDLMNTIYDCGYNFAVGDGFVEIHKV